jgi:hypothetical protein
MKISGTIWYRRVQTAYLNDKRSSENGSVIDNTTVTLFCIPSVASIIFIDTQGTVSTQRSFFIVISARWIPSISLLLGREWPAVVRVLCIFVCKIYGKFSGKKFLWHIVAKQIE